MKNKFRIFVSFIVLSILLSIPAFANNIRVVCDGKEIQFDQPPINEYSRVMVPIRFVAEELGWEVGYDNGIVELSKITEDDSFNTYFTFIDIPNAEIRNFISENQIQQLNETHKMNPTPIVINGRTLVGVRQLAEALYSEVSWDDSTKTVIITSKPLPYNDGEAVMVNPNNNIHETDFQTNSNEGKPEELKATYEQQRNEFEQELIKMVNQERVNAGLPEVTVNENLMALARWRAEEMFEYNVSGHISPQLNLEHTELAQYFGIDCEYAGENSYGQHGGVVYPKGTMSSWMNSQGHKDHILSPNVKEIGVGYHNGCWTLWLMY